MRSIFKSSLVVGLLLALPVMPSQAQAPGPAPGGQRGAEAAPGRGGRGPAEFWYVNKKTSVVYTPPNRPLWKLSDLLQMHAGQNNWSQEILKDDLQDVTYNSAAPGTKFIPRMHSQTASVYVVMKGEMHFTVEGQGQVTATRGSIVNILNDTVYSFDITGSQNALWININPLGVRTEYPATEPPPPPEPGTELTKVTFTHSPGVYGGTNRLMYNLFDAIAKCEPAGYVVAEDHIYINPLIGYPNIAENKCPSGGRGAPAGAFVRGPGPASTAPFDPNSVFGHLHEGVREWWIVQAGAISGKFEKTGEFHAVEGDVLNAEQDMWHQMGVEGTSGPSVRTAISAYNINNFGNTASPAPGR